MFGVVCLVMIQNNCFYDLCWNVYFHWMCTHVFFFLSVLSDLEKSLYNIAGVLRQFGMSWGKKKNLKCQWNHQQLWQQNIARSKPLINTKKQKGPIRVCKKSTKIYITLFKVMVKQKSDGKRQLQMIHNFICIALWLSQYE